MALYLTFPVSDWIMNPSELMKSATFAAKASAQLGAAVISVMSTQAFSLQLLIPKFAAIFFSCPDLLF